MSLPPESLPQPLADWRRSGQRAQIYGREVFYHIDGPEGAPYLLLLHGFPTASYDFHAILPALRERYRVICHDHLGFGFSEKPRDYSYSLVEQAEIALGLWLHLGVKSGHLLAHDYGTSVATEVICRVVRGLSPVGLKSLTLSNGSVYIHLAKLTITQKLTRIEALQGAVNQFMTRGIFGPSIAKVFHKKEVLTEAEIDALWAGITHNDGVGVVTKIQRYLSERERFFKRWTGALQAFKGPAHILWGREDPVAIPAIADALAEDLPHARRTFLEGVGHYPMLEAPEEFAGAALDFLDALGESSAP